MSWKNVSVSERGPLLERAARVVRDVVTAHRRRGVKAAHAFADAALDLDVTPRRVRSLYYLDGVWTVTREEHDKLLRRWGAHLDERQAATAREVAAIELQRAQLQFDLDSDNNQTGATEWVGTGISSRRGPLGEDGSP